MDINVTNPKPTHYYQPFEFLFLFCEGGNHLELSQRYLASFSIFLV